MSELLRALVGSTTEKKPLVTRDRVELNLAGAETVLEAARDQHRTRMEELEAIEASFPRGRGVSIQGLTGQGGIGKTALAKEAGLSRWGDIEGLNAYAISHPAQTMLLRVLSGEF